jgi:hypothetical protein
MQPRNNRLDQWLDSALREYGRVESRPGLEGRILANLELETTVSTVRMRRWWVWASTAAVLVAGIVLWLNRSAHRQNADVAVALSAHPVGQRAAPPVTAPAEVVEVGQASVQKHLSSRRVQISAAARGPRQEQFPSFRPLSEQEELLVRYAREFPKEAFETAQSQAFAEAQRQREELAAQEKFETDSNNPSR